MQYKRENKMNSPNKLHQRIRHVMLQRFVHPLLKEQGPWSACHILIHRLCTGMIGKLAQMQADNGPEI